MMTRAETEIYARTWKETAYVRGGRIKGVGIDCGTLLGEYLIGIGRCTAAEMDAVVAELGFLSNDWFCHATAEKYKQVLERFAPLKGEGICRGMLPAEPGDIALFRVVKSNLYNHGAILLSGGRAIHAVHPQVAEMRPTLHPMTAFHEIAIFDPWGAAA